jgi:hypothetical protein
LASISGLFAQLSRVIGNVGRGAAVTVGADVSRSGSPTAISFEPALDLLSKLDA